MALYIVKPWYKKEVPPEPALIYGAEWAGGSSPVWTRTDAAVNFTDPNPYYSGMSTTPSSPFDNIMPWSGMRRVTDASGGELVEIPKFYYKWTRDGIKMKLQISMSAFDGSHVSPAHADRGDGVGERDYVYVGRYHCSSNDYKSVSGITPKVNITRDTARTSIHALGTNIWQFDFALWWTISMLYLVEFANWNSQAMIGSGGGNGSSVENNGASDTMPYHTGTMKTSRSTHGVGIQYRYIENLWANVFTIPDGVYFSGSAIYAIKNPSDFSDSTGGTNVGNRASNDGWVRALTNPTISGFEYALYPATSSSGSGTTYITDYYNYNSSGVLSQNGGAYNVNDAGYGLFYFNGNRKSTDSSDDTGSRLMVLPPSRII